MSFFISPRALPLQLAFLAVRPAAAAAPPHAPADVARAASALITRVVPGRSGSFMVEQIAADSGRDVFEVESQGERIVLRGSSGVAVASALNWYLEHVAGITIAIPLRPVALPDPAPRVPARARIVTPYKYRYCFNNARSPTAWPGGTGRSGSA